MQFKEIALRLRIPATTVRANVLRFLARGCDFARLTLRRPNFKKFTPRLTRQLLSK